MLTLSLPNAQFDTDPGVYDVKFQDVIEPFETVQVSRAVALQLAATLVHLCFPLVAVHPISLPTLSHSAPGEHIASLVRHFSISSG